MQMLLCPGTAYPREHARTRGPASLLAGRAVSEAPEQTPQLPLV